MVSGKNVSVDPHQLYLVSYDMFIRKLYTWNLTNSLELEDQTDMDQRYREIRKGEKGAWLSIATYIFLAAVKLIVGYMGNSEGLRADGLNNTTDVIASIAVLIGLRISQKPPDRDHHYGHFRAESISSLVASFIMLTVGLQVLIAAGLSLYNKEYQSPDMMTAWVSLFSFFVMYSVYRFNLRLSRQIESQAMLAAAHDNRSDSFVSLGAFVGIMGSQFGLYWLDALTAVIVGVIIVKTAWDIFIHASHLLTDGFDEKRLEDIRHTVANTTGVQSVYDIKGRMHGNLPLIDITIKVDPDLTVVQSHEIAEEIENRMLDRHHIQHVHIHIEPLESGKNSDSET